MERHAVNKRFLLLAVIILLFMVSLTFVMSKLVHETRDNKTNIHGIVYWSAAQVERELLKFLGTLDRYSLGDKSVSRDDVLFRLDILWSRISVFKGGEVGRQLAFLAGNIDVIHVLKGTLEAIEPNLLTLMPGDAEAYASIRERVNFHALPLFEMSQRINIYERNRTVDFRTKTMRIYWMLIFFIGGIFITGALMVYLLIKEARRANQSLTVANNAETALREAHDSLEQRVLERTSALSWEIEERKRAEAALESHLAHVEHAKMAIERQSEELANLAEELTEARDLAQSANRTKSEFLATMSHELRTPLNAIIGFSEMIIKEVFGPVNNEKYREYIDDIHVSGNHLLALINDILDLSKVESGQDDLYEEKINIADTVQSIVRLVTGRAEQHGVSLRLDIQDNPASLYADERKLKQILVNLLTNSIKFTDPGGEITLKVSSCRNQGYMFQIIDTGIGIAKEDIPKALSQFGQIDSALNRKYEGTGLGLPLTKSLAELHGGSLELESELGVGTSVTVSFPPARIIMDEVQPRPI